VNEPPSDQFSFAQPCRFNGGDGSSSTMIEPEGTTEMSWLHVGGSGSGLAG
jgi:hypothetical protein